MIKENLEMIPKKKLNSLVSVLVMEYCKVLRALKKNSETASPEASGVTS
jgi:hypothetical protein